MFEKKLFIDDNLNLAIKASLSAGYEIMKVYKRDFSHEIKEDLSPITIADKKANDVINKYLKITNIPVISEENSQTEYEIRKNWKLCWIVDPLDGTKEFIKRNGEFTVNIALINNGSPILGVIYIPAKKKLYFADVKKKEAYKAQLDKQNDLDYLNKSVLIKRKNKKDRSIINIVGSRSHMNNETQKFINNLKKENTKIKIIQIGSSLKFCLILENKSDIYPRFAPTMEWDTAAGHAICKANNVSVIVKETNEELRYNKEELINPSFICE